MYLRYVLKMYVELNGNVRKLSDGIGEALVAITPEMCRQAMLNMRHRLHLCAQ